MICYNKLGRPRRVCIVMKDVRRLTANNPPCKALFHEARALTTLGEYERARKVLKQAQCKEPTNKEINDEIALVDQRIGKYEKASRDLWSRALSGPKTKPEEPTGDPVKEAKEKEFKQTIEDLIEKFEKANVSSMGLSRRMYSDPQLEVLCDMIKEHKMNLTFSPIHEDLLTLSKIDGK